MIDLIIHLIVILLIIGVIWYVVETLLPLIPMPGPIAQLVRVLVIVLFALIIIFYVLLPLLHTSVAHW